MHNPFNFIKVKPKVMPLIQLFNNLTGDGNASFGVFRLMTAFQISKNPFLMCQKFQQSEEGHRISNVEQFLKTWVLLMV